MEIENVKVFPPSPVLFLGLCGQSVGAHGVSPPFVIIHREGVLGQPIQLLFEVGILRTPLSHLLTEDVGVPIKNSMKENITARIIYCVTLYLSNSL